MKAQWSLTGARFYKVQMKQLELGLERLIESLMPHEIIILPMMEIVWLHSPLIPVI